MFDYQFYNAQYLPVAEPRHASRIIKIVTEMIRENFSNFSEAGDYGSL